MLRLETSSAYWPRSIQQLRAYSLSVDKRNFDDETFNIIILDGFDVIK